MPGERLAESPLCPDSGQIPQRSETTRCAKTGPKGDDLQVMNHF
jgi:hypothetical protein